MPMPASCGALPTCAEVIAHLRSLTKPTVAALLARADQGSTLLVQPRCGVGAHAAMRALLEQCEREGRPDILTITIDSHTRLQAFERAAAMLAAHPDQLNGYPLCAHGWRNGRELNACVAVPLQVRHGSPDARALFAMSLASGLTAFEGGGITYNVPYCKDVPLTTSLQAWAEIDAWCGELAQHGIIVDRELFGTLTAALMPPSLSVAIVLLEALLAARAGVRCISLAYPQGGHVAQDVAALRVLRKLAREYLPASVQCYPVLHEFMGAFPADAAVAQGLIFYGAIVARLGRATKIVTKTYAEALGIPTVHENIQGIRLAKAAQTPMFDWVTIDEAAVAEEEAWMMEEVRALLAPPLDAPDLSAAIVAAFTRGRLDVPFAASRHVRSAVIPMRDAGGAIRYAECAQLPFSERVRRRHRRQLRLASAASTHTMANFVPQLQASIDYFATQEVPTS